MASLLEVRDLSVCPDQASGATPVLDSVNLTVRPGESFGIVGESGAGKSVLLRAILRLLPPSWSVGTGHVLFRGEDLQAKPERHLQQIRGKLVALMPSNPRQHLNPVRPVGRQITDVILAHEPVSRGDAIRRAIEVLTRVGIPDPASRYHAYPHELSGGMCQRIIIAMGLANAPVLTLADEPTSGLDVTISLQILDLMQMAVTELNSALILVSRDLGVIAHYCQRIAVMYAGEVVEQGDVLDFFDMPLHPYSRHLLRAARAARDPSGSRAPVSTPRTAASAVGCKFAPRCPIAAEGCRQDRVPLRQIQEGRHVRCLRTEDILAGVAKP